MTAVLPLRAPAAAHTLPPAAAHRGRWCTRALVVLAVLAVTVLGTGTTAAKAGFSDSAALRSVSVGTGTVAPAMKVRVDARCETTATEVRRVYRVDSLGNRTLVSSSTPVTTTSTARGDEGGTTQTTTNGPGPDEVTVTTVTKDTELYATARWDLSTSARVTGYRMTAHTSIGAVPIGDPGPIATSMTRQYDADVLQYRPRVSIDTLTDYGWTATSATVVVSC
jgi:hypothetical protein